MNNYIFCTAEADIEPVAQQPYADQEDMVSCDRISVVDQYDCRHKMHSQAMHHMLAIPANTATRKSSPF